MPEAFADPFETVAPAPAAARGPITVTLPYPISANAYWAHRVITPKGSTRAMALTHVTHEARAYKQQVAWLLKAAGVRRPIEGRVAVEIDLYPHRPQDHEKRKRQLGASWDDSVRCIDLGNCEKVLSDALKDVAFADDKWLWDIHLRRKEPDGDGRVVVRITPLVNNSPQESLL